MRLIDADALKKKKVRSTERCEWVVPVAEIDWMPTIEPERKTGKWIDDEFLGQYRCSEGDYYSIDEYSYCPNCGARMEGE